MLCEIRPKVQLKVQGFVSERNRRIWHADENVARHIRLRYTKTDTVQHTFDRDCSTLQEGIIWFVRTNEHSSIEMGNQDTEVLNGLGGMERAMQEWTPVDQGQTYYTCSREAIERDLLLASAQSHDSVQISHPYFPDESST